MSGLPPIATELRTSRIGSFVRDIPFPFWDHQEKLSKVNTELPVGAESLYTAAALVPSAKIKPCC